MAADRRALVRKLFRYTAGSVVATVCSEVTLVLLYGVMGVVAAVASVVAWFAGAVPNYWLNRSWTWGREGRPSMRREIAPYAAIVLGTLLVAVVVTTLVDRVATASGLSSSARTAAVGFAFFFVYVVMFLVRFALFDRLFGQDRESTDVSGARADSKPR